MACYDWSIVMRALIGPHLGVELLQLGAQCAVVVDLAIDGERGVPGGVGDGLQTVTLQQQQQQQQQLDLSPRQQPVDGESLVGEVTVAEAGDTVPVRTTVSKKVMRNL